MNYKETSREAFRSHDGPTLDSQILSALQAAGKSGLTDQEIETTIGRSHQAVSGNRRHLVERGLVRESGRFGKTSSGRKAIKWIHWEFFEDEHDAKIHSPVAVVPPVAAPVIPVVHKTEQKSFL